MKDLTATDLQIPRLGEATILSPLVTLDIPGPDDLGRSDEYLPPANFVNDDARCMLHTRLEKLAAAKETLSLELAGPRKQLFFEPHNTHVGIVTCGGLCPGLNDVIRALVLTLWHSYNIREISGFRYGYQGLHQPYCHTPMELSPERVRSIRNTGGTVLGAGRCKKDTVEVVDTLERMGIKILFVIGGDGTQRGALDLADEIRKRGASISIVGIPKTIDNDILYLDKSFGFETAFSLATHTVRCAHTEAEAARNGVGLVKLMGRDSGSIAASAALATNLADIVLIPEVPFTLKGPGGLLAHIRRRLEFKRHCCVIVAEGAGQEHLTMTDATDPTGNVRFGDIGTFLKDAISADLDSAGMEHTVKYIDPSYMIRSAAATAKDSLYCLQLAQGAVHAAMSGRTEMVVGQRNNAFVHLPMRLITRGKQCINPDGRLYRSLLETTGQPARFE
ncbi:MAG: ATP-dependent 6-phosphofructokinase [Phycisphaerales bacterium]|nr:ATP-dependent 6-phosphofructokinase [Phycisphaerales bacterium]